MPATVRAFSDLTCPWAYLTAWRLRRLAPDFADDFDRGRFRGRVMAESQAGSEEPHVAGSPTLVLPDGSLHPGPGVPRLKMDEARVVAVQPAECPGGVCLGVLRGILQRAATAAVVTTRAEV